MPSPRFPSTLARLKMGSHGQGYGRATRSARRDRHTLGSNVAGIAGALFANPLFVGLLGAAIGAVMLLVSRVTSKTMTPDNPTIGFARVAFSMILRLAGLVSALFAFYMWNRPMLTPFGIGLIAGFMIMIGFELFVLSTRSGPSVR